jgi:hypothetical protein
MRRYPYRQQNITIHFLPTSSAIIYECSIHFGRRASVGHREEVRNGKAEGSEAGDHGHVLKWREMG